MIVHIFLQVRNFYSASAAQMFCEISPFLLHRKKDIQVKIDIRVSK